jgi:hypothetical protein
MPNKSSLSEIQARFAKILKSTRPKIKSSESLFAPSRGPQAALKTRLGIYRHAYFARIEESLADDFPKLRETLGPKSFSKLIRHYLKGYPSQYPGLAQVGKNLPSFLAELPELVGDFAEQTEMEWAQCLCKWSESAEPTHFAELQKLPEEERLNQKLVLSPNTQFVTSRNQAISSVVFYKVRNHIKNQELSPSMEKLLGEIRKGRTLGELITMLSTDEKPAADADSDSGTIDAATALQWISNWVAEGLIVGFLPA